MDNELHNHSEHNKQLAAISQKLDLLLEQGALIMAIEDDILQKVSDQTTIINSVEVLVQNLKALALSAVPDPTAKAKLQAALDNITSNDAALAVIANTSTTSGAPLGTVPGSGNVSVVTPGIAGGTNPPIVTLGPGDVVPPAGSAVAGKVGI
jgi:hypothetical protein